ncbi:MAG: hypothetical protein KTR31_27175 [Myxococcales bacterium]|nr:hypothetical protein [Myxococcales bacterium]
MEPREQAKTSTDHIVDQGSALATMLGSDPMARSPKLLEPDLLEALEGGKPLAAFVKVVRSVEQGDGILARSMQQAEEEWSDTAVVPLARGYRLRIVENLLASAQREPLATQAAALALITPLEPAPEGAPPPRTPLEWLGGAQIHDSWVRNYADRWVLQGWMTDPEIPLEVLAPLLSAPQYDGLRATPMGALVLARAERREAEVQGAWQALEHATQLSLQRVAADRDKEQAAWADTREAEAERLEVEDPIASLLQHASVQLTAAAGDARAAGGALLALSALRWGGTCALKPCIGVDRVSTMRSARRWHPDVDALASLWQVIALKDAVDTLEVGHDTALFPTATVGVVDALLGTGGGPIDGAILQKRRPDPAAWLTMARAVGKEGVVDWEGAREAVGEHLQREVSEALNTPRSPEVRSLLERIERRAVP